MKQIWDKIKPKGDQKMWLIIYLLMFWGLLAVYSSVGALAYKKAGGNTELYLLQQLFYLSVGLLIMFVLHSIHYKYYLSVSKFLLLVSYVLLILTLLFGVEINHARRWISIMGITLQTSDYSKVALILYITRTLSKRQDQIDEYKKVFMPIIINAGSTCLLIAPENLSTACILFGTSMLVMYLGRVNIKHLAILSAAIICMASLMVLLLFLIPSNKLPGRTTTWKSRIEGYFKTNDKPNIKTTYDFDKYYQINHSKIAFAGGGVFGRFIGNSVERNILPEAYSDFIYAIIGEEWGMIGAVILLLLYMFFLFRILRIIRKSPHAFGALVAAGLGFSIVMQALINMAVSVDLLPNTGLTLPLISKGGTAIFFTSIAFGVIMSVSRHIETDEPEAVAEINKNNNTIEAVNAIQSI